MRAIISKKEHIFNPETGVKCRFVKKIDYGNLIVNEDNIVVRVTTFGQFFEDKKMTDTESWFVENLLPHPLLEETLIFTNEEVQGLFQILQNPIETNENFLSEFNNLILNALLFQTKSKGYFDNDDWEIFTETEPVITKIEEK